MNKKWVEFSINIVFWLITSWLIVYSYSIITHNVDLIDDDIVVEIGHSKQLVHFFLTGQPFFAIYFYLQFFLILKLNTSSKNSIILLQSTVLAILFLIVFNSVVVLFFNDYIHFIWFPSLWYGVFIFYTTIAISYGLVKVWFSNEQDKRKLEVLNKEAELNRLRAQLHPHFLFNTMNNLLAMVDQKQHPKLAMSIDKLSNLLRYVVYENQGNTVTLIDEINFIHNFSKLHLLRFEDDEIDFNLEVIGKYDQQQIEKGILLCFVENAFKHGVQPEYNSFIHITIAITNPTTIDFTIENSIPPKIEDHPIGGFGLKSTKDRLALAYPNNKHSLIITEAQTYTVSLSIKT